jgi:hypothetical protein
MIRSILLHLDLALRAFDLLRHMPRLLAIRGLMEKSSLISFEDASGKTINTHVGGRC